jgi:hypothetical protein
VVSYQAGSGDAGGRGPDNFGKLIADLPMLERYEHSALARKRRAVRKFDPLRDDEAVYA